MAGDAGVLLSQFHNRRWDGGFLTAQELLAEGKVGEVALFEANYDRWLPTVGKSWRDMALPGSGVLFDLGTHLVDQAIALFGRPRSVTATLLNQRHAAVIDDYFNLELDYGRTQVLLRACMLAATPGPRYRLCGSRGTYVKHGPDPQVAMLKAGRAPGGSGWGEEDPELYGYLSDGHTQTPVKTKAGCYQIFYRALAVAITESALLPVPVEDARDTIAIIEAAKKSHKCGCRISAADMDFLRPPKV
jgi:scyllo-inositol 2-dehydrogenase (NADP+)